MTAGPAHATERAALMLQLVPYLIARGEVALSEAAARFEVTEEQMRRMVEQLTLIGLPGEGGFTALPGDLFDIDWDLLDEQDRILLTHTVGLEHAPKLTAREASALLAGLQLARSLPGLHDDPVIAGLLAKLARGAADAPADVVIASESVDDVRRTVDEALQRGLAVSFTYRAPDAAPTTRTVDPVQLRIADGQWYLQGWCHLRQAMRTFHLDRIGTVAVTDIPSTHAAAAAPELFTPGSASLPVRIRYVAAVAGRLGGYLDGAQIQSDGDVCTAVVQVAGIHSLKRLAVGMGGAVEILAPAEARAAAADWAAAALALYSAGPDAHG